MNKWGGPLDKQQWISKDDGSSRYTWIPESPHAGCLGPQGTAAGQTGRPRASSRLLSFRFGQQTKDWVLGPGVFGLLFTSGLHRLWPNVQLLSGRSTWRVTGGDDIVGAEALLREARHGYPTPLPSAGRPLRGGPQSSPGRGCSGGTKSLEKSGRAGAPGPLWCQPRQLGFLLFVIQAPDSALVAESSLQTW